jgi:hypothetical protein
MFSLRGELPGPFVAKVVESLDYVSFPVVCATRRNLYNWPKPGPNRQGVLKLEASRADTRRCLLLKDLLPECDMSYKRVYVVSCRIRLRGIAAEDKVPCSILGNREASCCNLIDGSKPTLTTSTAMNMD